MDDGRNAYAYSEMLDEAQERIAKLRATLKKIADLDDRDGIAPPRMVAHSALVADDEY